MRCIIISLLLFHQPISVPAVPLSLCHSGMRPRRCLPGEVVTDFRCVESIRAILFSLSLGSSLCVGLSGRGQPEVDSWINTGTQRGKGGGVEGNGLSVEPENT